MVQKWAIFDPKMTHFWPKNGHFWTPFLTGPGQKGPILRGVLVPYEPVPEKGVKKGVQKWVKNGPFLDPFFDPFFTVQAKSRLYMKGFWPEPVKKGVQKGVKNGPKSGKNGSFLDPFFDPFFQVPPKTCGRIKGFGPGPVKKGSKKGSKNGQKRVKNGPFLDPFFDPLFTGPVQKGPILGAKCCYFGPLLIRTWSKRGQKWGQKWPKKWSKRVQKWPFLANFWLKNGPKHMRYNVKSGSKVVSKPVKMVTPRTWGYPRFYVENVLRRVQNRGFWTLFWPFFDPFLDHFWAILG